MLTQATLDTVKATVPFLVENGEALTRHFYRRMFAQDPEVKAFFNPAHQVSGAQQRALAAAVCAFAENIETPENLAEAVELIAHKHVSLTVKPEHYPIVGRHLLGAIADLLGESCTDAILAAWKEAYGFLADVLITREAELYAEHRSRSGWEGFKPFRVVEVVEESAEVRSFHFAAADGAPHGDFLPGQYLTVRIPLEDGGTTMRNYTVSSDPADEHLRISVKRERAAEEGGPDGRVSRHLHDHVGVGDVLEIGPPCGTLVLDDDERPLVLISGGIGVTPMIAMLKASLRTRPERPVHFLHGARNPRVHALRDEVEALARRHDNLTVHVRYSDPDAPATARGLLEGELVAAAVGTTDAVFYCCGPTPFMAKMRRDLLEAGVRPADVRHESFGPAVNLESETALA